MKRIFALFAVYAVLCLTLPLSGCTGVQRYESSYVGCFDTAITAAGYFHNKAEADAEFQRIFEDIQYCNRLFDIYHSYSGINNLKTVNDSSGEWVSVDGALVELLLFSREAYEKTEGAVNIAMGSVLVLWHDAREADTPYIPEDSALQEAAQHTDIASLEIDIENCAVRLTDPLTRLDVGAVAKGWTAEYAAGLAQERGVESLLLNLGGNVRMIGQKPVGNWNVAVENPTPGYPDICTLSAADTSIVTSGDYQRYFELDGVRYCHIIDPDTLYPANRYRSVTVVCADSGWADALSTALFILDTEEGRALIDAFDAQAMWVHPDGGITYSGGMEQYFSD